MAGNFKKLSDQVKPREQLKAAVSPVELSSEALLAILLKTGSVGCNVMETARRLLGAFGSVTEMVKSDWRTLEARIREYNGTHPETKIKGIGEVKVMELAAAFELVRRGYEVAEEDIRNIKIKSPENALPIFRKAALLGDEQENFFVLPLDTKNHPMCTTPLRVMRGTMDRTPVHAREVFKAAIRWGAHAIIVAHNHPSGDPTPSAGDVASTKRLVEVSQVVGIPLLDHLVLGGSGYVSIRKIGKIDF